MGAEAVARKAARPVRPRATHPIATPQLCLGLQALWTAMIVAMSAALVVARGR